MRPPRPGTALWGLSDYQVPAAQPLAGWPEPVEQVRVTAPLAFTIVKASLVVAATATTV